MQGIQASYFKKTVNLKSYIAAFLIIINTQATELIYWEKDYIQQIKKIGTVRSIRPKSFCRVLVYLQKIEYKSIRDFNKDDPGVYIRSLGCSIKYDSPKLYSLGY